jgi:hypothetical protein
MIETAPVATYHAPVRSTEQLLPLPAGGVPQTIYISITGSGTTLSVAFSLTQGGIGYADGMSWPVAAEYALFLNFVFVHSTLGTINEVQPTAPGLWISETTTSPSGVNQQGCVQPILGTYTFKVSITPAGGDHAIHVDPKIVVTPDHL